MGLDGLLSEGRCGRLVVGNTAVRDKMDVENELQHG
jgi:hypothetical protein